MSRRVDWGHLARRNVWLIVLFLYMLTSAAWSDVPAVSFKRWVKSIEDLVMVLVILTEADPLEAECTVLRRALFVTIPLSIVFIKYFRNLGTMWDDFGNEMWIGATTHKNVLGEVAMTAGIVFLLEAVRHWRSRWSWVYLTYVLMALWILNGSPRANFLRSNTSVIGLALGTSLMIVLYFFRSNAAYVGRFLLAGVFAASLLFLGFQLFQSSEGGSVMAAGIEATGRDLTLSGRTNLWNDLLNIAREHPFVGVGFGSFWIGNTHHLWEKHLWMPTQGHNGYIDVYLELGAIGLLLLGGVIIAAFRGISRLLTENFLHGMLHLIWFTIIVFHNMTESSYLRGSVDLWFLFLLSVTAYSVAPAAAHDGGRGPGDVRRFRVRPAPGRSSSRTGPLAAVR
jgi:O-antigen ligase